ncbi:activator of 90 kDa heat shock protein ATPase homolog 1-like [Denticeps clupeoides]|uniref:activator of 90 kDa heat shock protein ATPase homolog 1-like n=1 Tax=Denticeps clupeoides TaxID=299321 RepID=UPI0010A32D5A|nr:activator of 90 kDa heat shock protein ATPase homolog 1-like [Denticeps clupeoides]XP_028843990.1 activator of 90 kDa heat shock protein ATPase homolog 1-like [Denticeps clupeoides]
MAKWGEGDPRWIVEERADATNVNNWHWTERDATNWSSEKLKELLLAVRVENEDGKCEVTEVSTVEGEASINNRKGKLIFFYEWNLKAKWKGISKSGIKYKGSVEVPNLSDENDMDELDIAVSLSKDEPDTPLMALMKKEGAETIRAALGSYVSQLKTEFTQGMILPTANGVSKQQPVQANIKVERTQIGSSSSAPPPSNTGVKIPTCKFSIKDTFLTSPEDLYRVFVHQEMVQAFTHAAAVVEADKGGKFRLLNGNVLGEFVELVPEQKIVMKWRYNTWPCEHYATIALTFTDRGNETELGVECRGVPQSDEDQTREGWQRYYFQAIKQTFGYGARLY